MPRPRISQQMQRCRIAGRRHWLLREKTRHSCPMSALHPAGAQAAAAFALPRLLDLPRAAAALFERQTSESEALRWAGAGPS
jgi:hypothetical protein